MKNKYHFHEKTEYVPTICLNIGFGKCGTKNLQHMYWNIFNGSDLILNYYDKERDRECKLKPNPLIKSLSLLIRH
jgi:hypothetical protein